MQFLKMRKLQKISKHQLIKSKYDMIAQKENNSFMIFFLSMTLKTIQQSIIPSIRRVLENICINFNLLCLYLPKKRIQLPKSFQIQQEHLAYIFYYYKIRYVIINYQTMSRNSGKYGRGQGSFRLSEDRGMTPEKKMKSSFRYSKRNINFDPKQFITAQTNEKEIQMFKQVFDYLDDDHDGMLTPLDFRKAIKEYGGFNPPRSFVYVAMSNFDVDEGGQITFKEFVKLMTTHPCDQDTEDEIQRVFTYIDEDNKGFISPEDLMACADQLKQEVTPAEVREMIANCDPDGNGVITKEAFVRFNKKGKFD